MKNLYNSNKKLKIIYSEADSSFYDSVISEIDSEKEYKIVKLSDIEKDKLPEN